MTVARPQLRALATQLGIVDAYCDISGARHDTSDETREALCAAMGRDASSETSAESALATLASERRSAPLEPVRVWRQHARLAPPLDLRHPGGRGPLAIRIELELEGGANSALERNLPELPAGTPLRLALPAAPPVGVHHIQIEWKGGCAKQHLVVAPRRAFGAAEALSGTRGFGVWTNLYTVRSQRSNHWGFGDLSDLAALARLCGDWGGDFVGVSPLHAIPAREGQISPYGPTSRLFRNPMYLDIEAVPEFATCRPAKNWLATPAAQETLASLRGATEIDYAAVLDAKLAVLRELFRCSEAHSPRRAACDAYRKREGAALVDFATFEAIAAEQGCADWRRWPASLRDARSPAVARFRAEHAREVDFRCWLQFELDRQLGEAAEAGRGAGLRVGLYGDLAVGSSPGSADTWSFSELFASGVHVGAPPDAFAAGGQDWGVAPLDPHALRADGYRFFARLLRDNFRHCGALRIDHVMGFERLFWIPQGRPASEGTYVRYPRDELFGVLALESRRHRAVVVGEDLGTVPADLPPALASWGILSSSVLTFEREGAAFRPASQIPARTLASANTHDLTPLAGWLDGRDLDLLHELGELPDGAGRERAQLQRAAERAAWLERLRAEGVFQSVAEPTPTDWCRATSAFLAKTAARLVGVSLDDLTGETEPLHLPGIGSERYPGWRRRMGRTLEELAASAPLRAGLPQLGRTAVTLPPDAEGA
ncbi:MAG: 4-alpha-glucanotransferase [Deltaproteobacteria bacterium]|jgi:4-alpha-glucanotransferase|nr:4-alpha-glucanotransferase [Deltaproteobacteria bacterium]